MPFHPSSDRASSTRRTATRAGIGVGLAMVTPILMSACAGITPETAQLGTALLDLGVPMEAALTAATDLHLFMLGFALVAGLVAMFLIRY